MAKKLAIIMTAICVVLAGFIVKMKLSEDNVGPVITYGEDFEYKSSMSDKELLADVKAVDDLDGDVSSTLIVEDVHALTEESVVIVYVAKDNSNNVSKIKRVLGGIIVEETVEEETEETADGEEEAQDASESDQKDEAGNGEENASETEEAASEDAAAEGDGSDVSDADGAVSEDGTEEGAVDGADSDEAGSDVTTADASGLIGVEETTEASETETQEPPADGKSEADLARETQVALADAMAPGYPRMYLTDYYIEIPVGTTIDAMQYVENIVDDVENFFDLSKKIHIYDANGNQPGVFISFPTAGTYEYTFYVIDNQGLTSNNAVLKVVAK